MRTLGGLREDLDSLDSRLAALRRTGDSPSVAVMAQGLVELRADLAEQFAEASRARFDVVLDGAPVVGHEVRIDALSQILHSLQEAVSSVAQSLKGTATAVSSLPAALRDETALHFAGAYPGSFGALLRGPQPTEAEQMALINVLELAPTVLDRAVETVLDIVDLADSDDEDEGPIVDAVLPLGPRAFKHLSELSVAVVDEDLTTRFVFRSPSVRTHTSTLTRRSATRLRDVLGRNTESEDEVSLRGRLGTVSDIHNRIDLQTEEGVISAKVTDDLVPVLRQFYTERVVATFTRRTATSTVTGMMRQSYILVGLVAADSGTGG